MNKFVVALKIMITKLDIKKSKLEEEGKLRRTGLNQSMKTKRAPRADKIDAYLKAFGVTWMDYAKVLMQVEANWDRLQVQPAEKEKIMIDGQEIDLETLSDALSTVKHGGTQKAKTSARAAPKEHTTKSSRSRAS